MSTALAIALQNVDLKPGRTYQCRVKDVWIELRVAKTPKELLPVAASPDDVMLDPWADFPYPEPSSIVRTRAGERPMPDLPDLPADI